MTKIHGSSNWSQPNEYQRKNLPKQIHHFTVKANIKKMFLDFKINDL